MRRSRRRTLMALGPGPGRGPGDSVISTAGNGRASLAAAARWLLQDPKAEVGHLP